MAFQEQAKAQAALDALAAIEDDTALVTVIVEMLRHRPSICPAVVAATCPDLTYAPAKAITERRATGQMKAINPNGGYGFISCPDLHAVFGCDIFAHQKQIGEIRPGTDVSFAVLLNKDNKPQAFDIAEEVSQWSTGGGQCKGKCKGGGKGEGCWGCGDGWGDGGGCWGDGGGCWGDGGCWGYGGGEMMPMMPNMMPNMMGGCGCKGCKGMDGKGMDGKGMGGKGMGGKGMGGKGMGGEDDADVELGDFEGTMIQFNDTKGMGFLQSPALTAQGYGDVFVHQKNINGFKVGDLVTFSAYLHKGASAWRSGGHSLQARDLQGEPGNGRGAQAALGDMAPPSKMAAPPSKMARNS